MNNITDNKTVVFDAERLSNITHNARMATKIYYKGTSIEVIFTNQGKFDGSEVVYTLPLQYLLSKQIYTLLSYKKKNKNERKRRNTKMHNHKVSSR